MPRPCSRSGRGILVGPQVVLQPPRPLHSFCPRHEFSSVLQPPRPLQSFRPLHACLAGEVAFDGASARSSEVAAGAALASGAAGAGSAAAGAAGEGLGCPPQAAPVKIPVTAAAMSVCVMFISILPFVEARAPPGCVRSITPKCPTVSNDTLKMGRLGMRDVAEWQCVLG